MTTYFKDCNGIVHVRDERGDGEYTLCGFAWDTSEEDEEQFNGGPMKLLQKGPSNCPECKTAANEIRRFLKGVRWSVCRD